MLAMLTNALVIARKELVDHFRDTRSILSAALYSLMGPAVVLLALVARASGTVEPGGQERWSVMAAVFALMAAFTGGMAPSMDMIAGERERRTLLPLIISAPSRRAVVVGKWMAASVLAAGGLVTNLLGFVLVFTIVSRPAALPWLAAAPALLSLVLLVAALETLVSTLCRSAKEANAYLSILMFTTMGFAMWLAFRPNDPYGWLRVTPVAGHQALLAHAFNGGAPSVVDAALALQLAIVTIASTVVVLSAAATLFEREEIAYGG
jgi:sodium transport system permease protein